MPQWCAPLTATSVFKVKWKQSLHVMGSAAAVVSLKLCPKSGAFPSESTTTSTPVTSGYRQDVVTHTIKPPLLCV